MIFLDGVDFTRMLPLEQGVFGSGVFSAAVDAMLLADGTLEVRFDGSCCDHIAFDFFKLETIKEPTSLALG